MKELARVTSIPDESNADAHSYATYASFGDEGVTATANAHGNLLQITRYFGNTPSGFYCVDLPETPPPNLITERMNKLHDSYQDRNVGMRLEFEDAEDREDWIVNNQSSPKMKFIDDRWPLFITETPLFDLSIQYIISKKTIYQKYTFELKNECQVESVPNIIIDVNLLIRNLNFIESNDENNRGDPDPKVTENSANSASSRNSEGKKIFYKTHHNTRIIRKHVSLQTGVPGRDTVALVIMPFINENYYNIEEKSRNCYRISPANGSLQPPIDNRKMIVTIAYTLELMGSDDSPATGDISKATQRSSQAREDLLAANRQMVDMRFERIPFAKENHLNFILRRNLEHILSVCSIPLSDSSGADIVPIVLTCGDISNHRIMAGASL